MFGIVSEFVGQEDGAVTADWVVLTAAVVGLAAAAVVSVQVATTAMGPAISAEIENQMVGEG